VRGADDCSKIVWIFHSIERYQEFRGRCYISQIGIFLLRPERDDALVSFRAGETIEGAAIFEADRRAGFARKIDDLLETVPPGSASDQYPLERALRPQCFDNRMNSNQNGQLSIIPRLHGFRIRAGPPAHC
jgi:hypothetical protein